MPNPRATFGPVYQPPKPPVAPPATSFTHGGMGPTTAPVPKATKTPVKVTVHPDGKVEVHHNSPATTTPAPVKPKTASKPATKPTPKPVVKPIVKTVVAPLTVEQQAQGLLDPVKKAILDAINARVGAEQGAITNYSKDLAGLMGSYAPASRAAYGNAEVGQASVDAATQATLSGQGQVGANELAAKLAQINADPGTAARLNAQAGSNVTGAVGALAGRGSASLSDLISRSASAQDYGAKLPGVAGLYGLQATKSAQSKATTDTANAVSQLEGQYPGLVTSLKQNQQQQSANETTRALAATQAFGYVPKWASKILGVPPGTPTAQVQTAQANLNQKAAYDAARLKIAQQNADTAQGRAQTAAAKAAFDSVRKAHPQLSPGQVATIATKAAKDAEDLYHGVTKTNAQGKQIVQSYTQTYQDAIKTLRSRYPSLGTQGVLKLVNSWYKPGEFGRPAKKVKPLPNTPTGPQQTPSGY